MQMPLWFVLTIMFMIVAPTLASLHYRELYGKYRKELSDTRETANAEMAKLHEKCHELKEELTEFRAQHPADYIVRFGSSGILRLKATNSYEECGYLYFEDERGEDVAAIHTSHMPVFVTNRGGNDADDKVFETLSRT